MKDELSEDENVDLLAAQNELEQHLASTELGFDVAVALKLDQRGIYDATRLQARKPEIYKACRKCLLMGVSAGTTADLLSLDIRTVNEVMTGLEAENAIPPYKKRLVKELRAVITLGVDMLMERARKGDLSAIDIAVLIDKVELLSGGVTSRVEHRASSEDEEAKAFYDQLCQRATNAGMVLEAEVLPQSGSTGRLRAPAVDILSQLAAEDGDQGPVRPPSITPKTL